MRRDLQPHLADHRNRRHKYQQRRPRAPSGTKAVSPNATTTYDFKSTGPGGTVISSATVNVNTKVDASISANPAEVHYRKIGEKVITQDTSTVTWKTSNAQDATLNGNKVDLNGSQQVQAAPADDLASARRPARAHRRRNQVLHSECHECLRRQLDADRVLHVTAPSSRFRPSLCRASSIPRIIRIKKHPQVGLVKSQQLELATLADGFKKYLEYDPDAKLSIEPLRTFADRRTTTRT